MDASQLLIEGAGGVRLNVVVDGPPGAPPILFAHSVGCSLRLWDEQVRVLKKRYRIVRYDARGHGASDAPMGDYRIEDLGGDALAILDTLGIGKVHLCGLSLGGTLGQWLAIHAPDRILSLTLADTAARLGTVEGWQARIDATLSGGTQSIADFSMTRFFSEEFRASSPAVVEEFRQTLQQTADQGFAGCCAVLRDCDFRADLVRIMAPTLVLCGDDDLPTPPADSQELAESIDGARLVIIKAGHISAVENPQAFTEALELHLTSVDGQRDPV